MKQSPFRYDTIFMHGSLQSVGHTMDYFIKHTKKLVIYIIMPRVQGTHNLLRVYDKGMLVEEKKVSSSSKLFQYYFLWWFYQQKFLFRYFARNERVLVLIGHPVALFGMSIIKLFRKVRYAYWIGDYFPPVNWSLILFEKLKKFYHDRVDYAYYLSDRLNEVYNGRVVHEAGKRTVMWGVQPFVGVRAAPTKEYHLLFIGVIRPSQGIEDLLLYVKQYSDVYVSILGSCEKDLYKKYAFMIRSYGISKRVWFPNIFIDDINLRKIARRHHVGIALYEKGKHTATHYTDPGKIKTYIELGLPVVMTDTSAIAVYIKKYNAGVVISQLSQLSEALKNIQRKFWLYHRGVSMIALKFKYESYYHRAFEVLEFGNR